MTSNTPDMREVFLARAGARARLFMAGLMSIDEAVDGLLDAYARLRPCACDREMLETLTALSTPRSASRRRPA
jgi:hypothetical protein